MWSEHLGWRGGILLLACAVLSACGGDDNPAPGNESPVANAGADKSAAAGSLVMLPGSGTDSDGTVVSFAWSQQGGPAVTLSGANTATASFTAPAVVANTAVTFRLVVRDNNGATDADTIVVTITPPGGGNQAPAANAGVDRNAASASNVALAGAATDADGTIASFAWSQVSGTAVTLNNANTQNASFTAPNVAVNTPLTFRLTVTDNDGATDTDDVIVTITPPAGGNASPVANAGADKNAASGSNVALPGAGTDSDGTIASFAWSQVSGTAVTLNNANTQNASFTAPNVAANTPLTFRLTVTDNDGATDTDDIVVTITPPAGGGNVPVTGKVTFARVAQAADGSLDYSSITQEPSRHVVVQALNAGSNAVIATVSTNDLGNFTVNVPASTSVKLRVRAEMTDTDVTVVNNTAGDAVYTVDSAAFNSGAAGVTQNVQIASGFSGAGAVTGARSAAPFAILDTIRSAQEIVLAADGGATFQPLEIAWAPGNVPTGGTTGDPADPCAANGEIGGTFYQSLHICVLGAANNDTDEYDADVLVREWGRYLLEQFARTDYIDGFPASHQEGDRLDMRVAFVEGFLQALTGVVGDGLYQESNGPNQSGGFAIDLEVNAVTAPEGWFNEGSIRAFLYDVYDGANDGPDTVNLGFGAIYDAIVGEAANGQALMSIFPVAAALKSLNPGSATALSAMLNGQSIVGTTIDAFGSTETNGGGGGANVLPIYTSLTLNAAPVNLCTTNQFGEFNALGNRRFARFTLAAQTTVTFTAVGGTDPDMVLYRDGVVGVGLSGDAGMETFQETLPAGAYVLEVLDFVNNDFDGGTGGPVCLAVDIDG